MDEFTVECEDSPDVVDAVKQLMFKSYSEASEAMWDWHKKHSNWFRGSDCPDFAIQLQSGSSTGYTYYDVH